MPAAIEVPMCIFHLINDFIIKILIVEFSTCSLVGKYQNLSICRNSTSIQHFFSESLVVRGTLLCLKFAPAIQTPSGPLNRLHHATNP